MRNDLQVHLIRRIKNLSAGPRASRCPVPLTARPQVRSTGYRINGVVNTSVRRGEVDPCLRIRIDLAEAKVWIEITRLVHRHGVPYARQPCCQTGTIQEKIPAFDVGLEPAVAISGT